MNQDNEQIQKTERLAYLAGYRAARVSLRESLPEILAASSASNAEIQLFALIDHLLRNQFADAVEPIDWSTFADPELARATFEEVQGILRSPIPASLATTDTTSFHEFLQRNCGAVIRTSPSH
jgi:1,6-anhydro-N-acetylmuramate kinase